MIRKKFFFFCNLIRFQHSRKKIPRTTENYEAKHKHAFSVKQTVWGHTSL